MNEYPEDSGISSSDPLLIDDDGLYITIGQMQFWLNNKKNVKLFKSGSPKFFKYYNSCRTYNMISDMIEDDPECAILYWDSDLGVPAFSFPMKGAVAQAFSNLGLIEENE